MFLLLFFIVDDDDLDGIPIIDVLAITRVDQDFRRQFQVAVQGRFLSVGDVAGVGLSNVVGR